MKLVIRFSFISFIFFSQSAAAQGCLELFKSAFQKMKNIPASGSGLSMKYAVNVQTIDGTIHSDNIEVTMFNKRVKIVSDDFTIYQDTKTMVVIQPEASTIFMTSPTDDAIQKSQLENFVVLQDSLFKYMELKNCVVETDKSGKSLKKISFHLPALGQDEFPIGSIAYWIEQETTSIKKIQLDYKKSDEQQIKSISFEFQKMSDQYQGSPFDGTALAKVLDAKSSLKAEYKDYSLIDKR